MTETAGTAKPRAEDFYFADDELTQEEAALRDVVRNFCDKELRPHVGEWYEAGTLPGRELAGKFGSLGVLGMHLDGYGCAGSSGVAYGVACRELEAVDSGLRSFVSVQGSLAMFAIHHFGSEEQRSEWLPKMAAGEVLGCFGLTEPDAGSDPASMRTRAERSGDDWVLNGTKLWITNGTIADLAIVWARTGDEGIRGFVVPAESRGFSAREIPGKLSLRASVTAELSLDDVRVPRDAVLPGARGLRGPLSCLNEARYGIAWGAVGAARACLTAALDYSATRVQFGRPLASFQLTQKKLAEMVVDVTRSGLVALQLGRLKDSGRIRPEQVSLAKLANVRSALDVARSARTVLGANGITIDYDVMRHVANLETVMTYEGTEEMHTLSIGSAVTGVAAFR